MSGSFPLAEGSFPLAEGSFPLAEGSVEPDILVCQACGNHF